MQDLRNRVEKESGQVVEAIEVEKVAYVLAKDAVSRKHTIDDDGDIQALRPPSPKRPRKQTPPLSKSPTAICLRKGPMGSPTFDEMGYELDYKYLCKVSHKRSRPSFEHTMKMIEKDKKELKRKSEIMGLSEEKCQQQETAWDDRVARDLGMAYHEVGIDEYEEWHKGGFHADPGDFENLSEKEKKRLDKIQVGSALRKGSKHRWVCGYALWLWFSLASHWNMPKPAASARACAKQLRKLLHPLCAGFNASRRVGYLSQQWLEENPWSNIRYSNISIASPLSIILRVDSLCRLYTQFPKCLPTLKTATSYRTSS